MPLAGVFLNDVHTFYAPASVTWPAGGGAATFINVYDWDVLVIPAGITAALPSRVDVCVGVYPCTLSIVGSGAGSSLLRTGNATISCRASSGCRALALDSIAVRCTGSAAEPVIRMAGGKLLVKGSSFADCMSTTDGAAVQTFAGDVTVEDSNFRGLESKGDGGAISVVGGLLEVRRSRFTECSAAGRGGAISAAPFQCSGETVVALTTVEVSDSFFDGCTAGVSGGALLAYGAVVSVSVSGSNFSLCKAAKHGGGIVAMDDALTRLTGGLLLGNTAGEGGGAISASDAQVELWGVEGRGNTVQDGGGGVLFWNGGFPALVIDGCGPGYSSESVSTCVYQDCVPRCSQCATGAYQSALAATECALCPPGTFSKAVGATARSACVACDAGKYSTVHGAKSAEGCQFCGPGTFAAEAGASFCKHCVEGSFVNRSGAQNCEACPPGSFSNVTGATTAKACAVCPAGTFALEKASACESCSAGTFSSVAGATGPAACVACGKGQYQPATGASSADACTACPAGSFSLSKRYAYEISTLSWDDAQAHCVAAGGYLAPIQTATERDQVVSVLAFGLDWWVGLRFDPLTHAWNWTSGDGEVRAEGWGPANPKQLPSRHACGAISSYQSTSGDVDDINSQWPYFASEFDLLLINASYSSNPGNYYNIDCADRAHWINGHVCAFDGATACLACNAGQYAPLPGGTACVDCPAGTYSNHSGAKECDPCPGANTAAATLCNYSANKTSSGNTVLRQQSASKRGLETNPKLRQAQKHVACNRRYRRICCTNYYITHFFCCIPLIESNERGKKKVLLRFSCEFLEFLKQFMNAGTKMLSSPLSLHSARINLWAIHFMIMGTSIEEAAMILRLPSLSQVHSRCFYDCHPSLYQLPHCPPEPLLRCVARIIQPNTDSAWHRPTRD